MFRAKYVHLLFYNYNYYCDVQVGVDLPPGFRILFKSRDTTITENDQASFADNHVTVKEVEYLPPITLLFTLPSKYPSLEPPIFTLQSNWLDRHLVYTF